MNLIIWLVVGGLIGWVASMLMRSPEGILMNVVVGIVGAFIGGWLFHALHWRVPVGGLGGTILVAFVGAVILLLLLRLFRRGRA
jgi:uncharacterized membrane protein YeaQ/YmgE (transglycosylase-associated protein family)